MANRRVGLIALGLLAGAALSAQTPTPVPSPRQTPVFRTRTTVVPVTVTVLNQKGELITDLKQSDFTVYENKSQREIVNFFPQAFVPGPAEPGDGLAPHKRRRFVFVLGSGRFLNVFKAIDRAIQFVREGLAPDDEIALMAFQRTTPFTTDRELIARILDRFKKNHDRLANDLWESWVVTTPALFGTRKPDDPRVLAARAKVTADIDSVFAGFGPLKNTATLVSGMDAAAQVDDRPQPGRESLDDVVSRLGGGSMAGLVADSNVFKLYAGIEHLRYYDGEKHVVFLSAAGGLAKSDEGIQEVARRATDARVIVDMIGNTEIGNFNFDWRSREVVERTGGYYSSLQYADKALATIDQRSRFSYLLGYDPLNPELDGKYREVEVKVNRSGAVVRFAHGYYARAEPDPVDVKALIIKSRVEAALAYSASAQDIGVSATALLLPRMGLQAQVRVDVTIEASQLGFAAKNGVRTDQLELQVYCGDAKDASVGEFGERLELEAGEDLYNQWVKTGIRRVVRVPVMGVPKFVKVIVYDYGSDRVGSFILTLK